MTVKIKRLLGLLTDEEEKQKRKRKRVWVHNICKKTMDCGVYHSHFPDQTEDDVKFFHYFRMTHEKFTVLLHLLKPNRKHIVQRSGWA